MVGQSDLWAIKCLVLCALLSGCHAHPDLFDPEPPCGPPPLAIVEPPPYPECVEPPPEYTAIPNPLTIAVRDPEFVWNQLVDTVDDYSQIASERRVRQEAGLLTEGYIEGRITPGATFLEPWLLDSASPEEKSLASLQSIRRQITMRVIPGPSAYQLFVQVHKELEDVNEPAYATPGSATPRHDGSLTRLLDTQERGPVTLGWISLGRDFALEQEILEQVRQRLAEQPDPQPKPGWFGF